MSQVPDTHAVVTTWRRRVFILWIAASIVLAALALIIGPIVSADDIAGSRWVAFLSPVAMAVFVLSGLAWLVLLAISRRRRPTISRNEHT